MRNLFCAGLLSLSFVVLATPAARAQAAAPGFPTLGKANGPAAVNDPARAKRQQQMSPEEAARDQQLQILEARTGNTSFGASSNGGRQYDKSGGAFTVRKYKGMPGQEQKRGMSREFYGNNPTGKPLVHHDRRKKFLFF